MPLLSHTAVFAFGALMGALLMAMITSGDSDKMANAIDGMSRTMREDMVMLPVQKLERKR